MNTKKTYKRIKMTLRQILHRGKGNERLENGPIPMSLTCFPTVPSQPKPEWQHVPSPPQPLLANGSQREQPPLLNSFPHPCQKNEHIR